MGIGLNMKRFLAVVAVLAVAGPAAATVVPRLTLEEIVARSEVVVHGRCVRTWAAWDSERRFIWTHSEIQVLDRWKGAAGATVVVSELGGVVGEMGLAVDGMPRYEPGEEVVLFLYRVPNGYWRTRGLGQGKYEVEVSARGESRARDAGSIEQFKTRVRGIAARPAAGDR